MNLANAFEAQVRNTPDAVAVVSGGESLSYAQLDARANRLAHVLRERGVGTEVLVAVCMHRGVDLLAALLAVLKTGGAYLPVDPAFPAQRQALMLEDARPALLLTHDGLLTAPCEVLDLGVWPEGSEAFECERLASGEQLAYVLYTSGSTGRPKGVQVTQRGVMNFLLAMQRELKLKPEDRLLGVTTLSFDIAVLELYLPLVCGACVAIAPRETVVDPTLLAQAIENQGITVMQATPSTWRMLAEQGWKPPQDFLLLCGGEALPRDLAERLLEQLPSLVNLYGPTETTVWSTLSRVQPREGGLRIDIGRPIANTQTYILDSRLKPTNVGVVGQLYIAGEGVARGYRDRPDLTAERFVPNPFGKPGSRMYVTGDLARWLPDKQLEYLGRADNQVKVRGFRIELEEIEAQLRTCESVAQAVVVARQDGDTDKKLVAYVTLRPKSEIQSDEVVDDQVAAWSSLWDTTYSGSGHDAPLGFDRAGWLSSYTRQALPAVQMKEWLDASLGRIKALRPERVLEIGAGTGMILFGLAPSCADYVATDIAADAVDRLQRQVDEAGIEGRTEIINAQARDFSAIRNGYFDTVVLNSIVQYFPSLDYLGDVIEGAIRTVGGQGHIFIGDVRHHKLLDAFHFSVQLSQAEPDLEASKLLRRVAQRAASETELLIDPAWFLALRARFPELTSVKVLPKSARHRNEMSAYRYDVVLGVRTPDAEPTPVHWIDSAADWEGIRAQIEGTDAPVVGLRSIRNPWIADEMAAFERLSDGQGKETAQALRAQLDRSSPNGVLVADLTDFCSQQGYLCELSWAPGAADGAYHAVIGKDGARSIVVDWAQAAAAETSGAQTSYANDPLQAAIVMSLPVKLRAHLARTLPEYMIPAAYVHLEKMPLTPNGKLDRKAMPVPEAIRSDAQYVAPRTATEQALGQIWAEVLKVERVGLNDNFFALGGHSLLAVQLVSRVRSQRGVEVALAQVFANPTLGQFAQVVERSGITELPPIEARDPGQAAQLSFAQQRLWFLDRLDKRASVAYHVPAGVKLRGALDVEALRRALDRIVERHEALRTHFELQDGEPVQRISERMKFPLALHDLSGADDPEQETQRQAQEEAGQAFDLGRGPLVRGRLLKLVAHEHVLLATMHHVVSDGWSMGVLIRELGALYEAFSQGLGDPLPPLQIQYADYAMWQRRWLTGEVQQRQLDYWKKTLRGVPELTGLPLDRARPTVQDHAGAGVEFALDAKLSEAINALARRHGTTPFNVLLAGWAALAGRLSGQDDIVIGTPVANRTRTEVEPLIGFFVNTLALRIDLSGQPGAGELVQRVHEATLAAQSHQDLPFEQVIEAVNPVRSMAHAPLFQLMLAWQNNDDVALTLGSVQLQGLATGSPVTKYDLSLNLGERDDGCIAGDMGYATALFERASIERHLGYLKRLLQGMVADEGLPVARIELLEPAEQAQLLAGFAIGKQVLAPDQSLHGLFEAQVARTPDAIALSGDGLSLSYAELNRRANRIAHQLRALGVGPDALVGLCAQRSVGLVTGLLGILKAGGAYVPLDPAYPTERLAHMLDDARPVALVTQAGQSLPPHDLPQVLVDEAGQDDGLEHNPQPLGTVDSLAYVIYTSGSTGKPKGSLNTHRNVLRLFKATDAWFGFGPNDVWTLFHSYAFDFSVWELWGALLHGGRLVVVPYTVSRSPQEFHALLRQEGVTVLNQTPSAFQQLMAVDLAQQEQLALRTVIFGGEALQREALAPWFERHGYEQPRLVNMYGITETTVHVTYAPLVEQGAQNASIGVMIPDLAACVLDGHGALVPAGVAGELHVAGEGLARGYLGRPDLTAQKFVPNPYGEPGSRMYATGDLVRWSADGQLEYLGRIDHQVKIRGFRIELGEIEAALRELPEVRDAVVLAREDQPGDKRLVAYVVAREEELGTQQVREALGRTLPEYMVPAQLMWLTELPLTPNGKLDRKALPVPDAIESEAQYVAPSTAMEQQLAQIWADVLKVERVGLNDNFFALGGHSLLAVQLMSRIRDQLQIEMPLNALFNSPDFGPFTNQVEATAPLEQLEPIPPVDREQWLALSSAQQRLWFLQHFEQDATAYNVPIALRLVGQLDEPILWKAFETIVQRHEILRTTFVAVEGRPFQHVGEPPICQMPQADVSALPPAAREARIRELLDGEAATVFDLASGPLLRIKIVRVRPDENLLLITMHHIVSDAWSIEILKKEFVAIYRALRAGEPSPLAPLTLQYADYAAWQRKNLEGPGLAMQLDYWKERLADAPTLLMLPTDRPRPALQTFEGASVEFLVPAEVTASLIRIGRQHRATLFMTLGAVYSALLSRYTGQSDICIGTPVAGRQRTDLEPLIGPFINLLVMRYQVDGGMSFTDLLHQSRATALDAFAHQDFPFESLVEELKLDRHLSHSPLFQALMQLDKVDVEANELPDVALEQLPPETRITKFDLSFFIVEVQGQLSCTLEYKTALFDASTIERMAGHFQTLLEAIASTPDTAVGDLPLITAQERRQTLLGWNDTAAATPDICLHTRFEQHARTQPSQVAVVMGGSSLTYHEANSRANRIAHWLRGQGVGPEVKVAICMERSENLIVAMLAILKAGGAYMPLDPAAPVKRMAFMVGDAGASIVITQLGLRDKLGELPARLFCIDEDLEEVDRMPDDDPVCTASGENLAYVIYTSGSTGNPKGVQITHKGIVNYLHWGVENYPMADDEHGSFTHLPLTFDASLTTLLIPLWAGKDVHIPLPGGNDRIIEPMRESQTFSTVKVTPAHVDLLAVALRPEEVRTRIRNSVIGGDILTVAQVRTWFSYFPDTVIVNEYGPTETVVGCCVEYLDAGTQLGDSVPIGCPISNMQHYILDARGHPNPAGVIGHLYIAGAGVARGYSSRPALTAEKFVPDPFGPPGSRMYATGDLARYKENGHIEFLGRSDNQVKIRGFRVELGEIEAALVELPGIQQATVLVHDYGAGQKQLVAYVVPGEGSSATPEAWREALEQALPKYMIPSHLIALDELPLTPSGKIDRKALQVPDANAFRVDYVAPTTETETELVAIWSEILQLERVGIHDNFFDIGGNSLSTVQLVSHIKRTFNVTLPLALIFENQTVARIAPYVDEIQLASANARPVASERSNTLRI